MEARRVVARNETASVSDYLSPQMKSDLERQLNASVLYNYTSEYNDQDVGVERREDDLVWVCIFIGVFLSVCAIISLLVLLYVFCTQRRRLRNNEAGDPAAAKSYIGAAEEGRATNAPEQTDLLERPQPQPQAQPKDITASISSSSDSETAAAAAKAP